MRAFVATLGAILVAVILSPPTFSQDRTVDLRSRFDQETNPVQKAKLIQPLGEAEFQQIRKDVEADRLSDALALVREYRDQAQSCAKGLDATKVDAEKHPSGFKQLQISVWESLRRVDALLPNMTSDEQAPFLELRKDLDNLNRHLIEQLFPQRTPATAKPDEAGQ